MNKLVFSLSSYKYYKFHCILTLTPYFCHRFCKDLYLNFEILQKTKKSKIYLCLCLEHS